MASRSRSSVELDPAGNRWELDRDGFLPDIQAKDRFMTQGYEAGFDNAPAGLQARGLLFAGMGFSGVSANLVRDAATRSLDTPFSIVKHYQFPHHVKSDWHTLAVSYSGETEETLNVARESLRRGVPMTAFTTGGTLAELATRTVPQPAGHQPRAALAYTWFSLLGFLHGSGLLKEKVPVEDAVAAVHEVDEACGPHVPEAQNEAKQLARKLWNPIPQIYATPAFFGVGLHFRGMINENAKKIAHVELVPECNHNDITGWGGDDRNRQHFTILALSHGEQNPEIRKRLQWMEDQYRSWGLAWHHKVMRPVHSFRQHVVEQARAIQFLDYTSFYTAMLREQDPSEIKLIRGLKSFLRS